MRLAILQIYCGASGQFGSYNCQEVGLAKAFAALGHPCTVVYPALGADAPRTVPLAPGAEALFLPAKGLSVHAFYRLEPLLELGIQGVVLLGDNHLYVPGVHRFCQKHGIRCINYLGALFSDSSRRPVRLAMNALVQRNLRCYRRTPCFAKTPTLAQTLRQAGVPQVTVAPVALDLSVIPEVAGSKAQVRAELGLPRSGRLLLYVGRLDAYKRPLEMAEVLAQCPPDVSLCCIGNGALALALAQRIDALGLRERFFAIPSLPNAEVQAYYRAADALLNFNDHEIFGMSILEALYGGCPVIARHAPGPDYILRQGETGFLVQDTAEYAPALERLTPAMGQAAHRDILTRFQWQNTAETLLTALEERHG